MDEMIAKAPEWFQKVDPKPHIYRAYADDPATSKAFAKFKADDSKHLKLLYCIDIYNEQQEAFQQQQPSARMLF
jgi:hypothetical protein